MTISTHQGSENDDEKSFDDERLSKMEEDQCLTREEERLIEHAASRHSIHRSKNSSSNDDDHDHEIEAAPRTLQQQQLQDDSELTNNTSPHNNNNSRGGGGGGRNKRRNNNNNEYGTNDSDVGFFNRSFFRRSKAMKASLVASWGTTTILATVILMVVVNNNSTTTNKTLEHQKQSANSVIECFEKSICQTQSMAEILSLSSDNNNDNDWDYVNHVIDMSWTKQIIRTTYAPWFSTREELEEWLSQQQQQQQQQNNITGNPPYAPVQYSYPFDTNFSYYNQMDGPCRHEALEELEMTRTFSYSAILKPDDAPAGTESPVSVLYYPKLLSSNNNNNNNASALSGVIGIELDWRNVLLRRPAKLKVVLENSEGQNLLFDLDSNGARYLGEGQVDDSFSDQQLAQSSFDSFGTSCAGSGSTASINSNNTMAYRLSIYSTQESQDYYQTNASWWWFVLTMVLLFLINTALFFLYAYIMSKRQRKTIRAAQRTSAVVNSLFPPNIRDRLLQTTSNRSDEEENRINNNNNRGSNANSFSEGDNITSLLPEPPKVKLKTFLQRSESGLHDASDFNNDSNNGFSHHNNNNCLSSEPSFRNPKKGGKFKNVKPIADFFPHTTVMFADISGFTAWSSEREPVQVFCLLETLFLEFDHMLSLHNVFKVETIGDCYVAVTGLPEPSEDHAVRLAKFASDCILVMHSTCQKLEAQLGPGTADLSLRVGLHSGSVTAGVLRGQKLRFQLFGDTVNTASRMEMYSKDNCIQCSQSTADLLVEAGKSKWLEPREDPIEIKGKGNLKTYWLRPTRKLPSIDNPRSSFMLRAGSLDHTAVRGMEDSGLSLAATRQIASQTTARDWGNTNVDCFVPGTKKEAHLVDWNVQILLESLEKVVVQRQALAKQQGNKNGCNDNISSSTHSCGNYKDLGEIQPFKEVTEIIELSKFNPMVVTNMTMNNEHNLHNDDGEDIYDVDDVINYEVRFQLHHFVSRIAQLYQDVPFHNLEHASHVTMSAAKLMNRIVTVDDDGFNTASIEDKDNMNKVAEHIHQSTFGIASDPLAQFAIIVSALIHDVEHTGLTNKELVEEGSPLSIQYDGVSPNRTRSPSIAWNILMEDCYSDLLRKVMFSTIHEQYRFRQLVVNTVMATDIIDKELQALRKNRWKKAFHDPQTNTSTNNSCTSTSSSSAAATDSILLLDSDSMNRKATIVIEHIIQASDVAHTMQHWHIFCKWNEKFFVERYRAYLNGHSEEDPSLGWYESEMGFFDFYIIPLAYKLKECGVFGVSCDEYLGFALENRLEWEVKGVAVVAAMKERVEQSHHKRNLLKTHPRGGNLETEAENENEDQEEDESSAGAEPPSSASSNGDTTTTSTTATTNWNGGDVLPSLLDNSIENKPSSDDDVEREADHI